MNTESQASSPPSFWRALGPGLIFAGTAVGVSHLYWSTVAGARYGMAMVIVVILANLLKYLPFSFGPRYAAATGTSLLEGYRRQGRWALVAYAIVTVGTMFTVQAAVTLLTVGLLLYVFGISPDFTLLVAALLTASCVLLLAIGRYRWLERILKLAVVILTLSVFTAAAIALPRIDFAATSWVPAGGSISEPAQLGFMVNLVGWMPSAIDVAVWSSLWTLAKNADLRRDAGFSHIMTDFKVGYIGTTLLALSFLVLGAGVLHSQAASIPSSPMKFSAMMLQVFESTLGAWIVPVIAAACLATMFSTTLAVVDGFPRALATLVERFQSAETPMQQGSFVSSKRFAVVRYTSMVVIALVSLFVIAQFTAALGDLLAIATALSFLSAPLLSWLNHRAITSSEVPVQYQPGTGLRALSWLGIGLSALFALLYLWMLG